MWGVKPRVEISRDSQMDSLDTNTKSQARQASLVPSQPCLDTIGKEAALLCQPQSPIALEILQGVNGRPEVSYPRDY